MVFPRMASLQPDESVVQLVSPVYQHNLCVDGAKPLGSRSLRIVRIGPLTASR